MLPCVRPEMCSRELLTECQFGYQMMVTMCFTSTEPSVTEHVTVGSTGWVSAIKPRILLLRVSSGRSHRAPLHCISSSPHRSHVRQAIGSCDSIKFTLESRDFASPFSIVRETSIESVGDGSPGIPTLDKHFGVSIACLSRDFKTV